MYFCRGQVGRRSVGGKGKFTRSLQTCIITAAALLSEVQRASSTFCLAVVAKEGWVGWEIRQDGKEREGKRNKEGVNQNRNS